MESDHRSLEIAGRNGSDRRAECKLCWGKDGIKVRNYLNENPDGRRERTCSLSGSFRSVKNVAVLRFFCALEELEKSSADVFQSQPGNRFAPSGR